jgi:hypothetical protein
LLLQDANAVGAVLGSICFKHSSSKVPEFQN